MFHIIDFYTGSDTLDMTDNFHVYNGTMNKLDIMEDTIIDGWHYQRCRIDVMVNNDFWTVRFPLESYQLRFYIEPNVPANTIMLVEDSGTSSYNANMGTTYAATIPRSLRRFTVRPTGKRTGRMR